MNSLLLIALTLCLVFTLGVKGSPNASRLHGSPNHLPAYPLAVRNPYLSAWLSGEFENNVTNGPPQFWNEDALTWNIMARVGAVGAKSATTYLLFGHPNGVLGAHSAVQKAPVTYTSTHTYVELAAGAVNMLLDFFSPVSPNNLTRQSMPYSYLTVQVSAPQKTDVQIFSAIDQTWTAQGPGIQVSSSTAGDTVLFSLEDSKSVPFVEHNDRALWGTTVFASQASQSSHLSAGCDTHQTLHSSFVSTGGLGKQNVPFPCPGDALYGLAHQLSGVKDAKSVTFAVGLYRKLAINYHGNPQTPYFRSKFPDIPSSINAFFADYQAAWQDSQGLDKLVRSQANQISGANYSDILEASVRQTFGALEVVIPADTKSTKPADVNAFLKEISSDGNVNSIDVIYPMMPLLYVLSPQWIKLLLQPVLEYLNHPTGVWSRDSVPHDLGEHYPNATGHDNNHLNTFAGRGEWMPLEVTGATLSMLLAYTNATGDYDFVKQYMGPQGGYLLTTYADFLVNNGTVPLTQLTTVDAIKAAPNTTQLAVQATLGVSAMGAISNMTNYTQTGADMTHRLLNDDSLGAMDPGHTHFTYAYKDSSSFSVMFPLFLDKLTTLAPQNSFAPAYKMQSDFYRLQLQHYPAGLPYSSRSDFAIVDWNMWSAAITASDVTAQLIGTTHQFLRTMRNGIVFGTKYVVAGKDAGQWTGNTARPTVGANFALWALHAKGVKW